MPPVAVEPLSIDALQKKLLPALPHLKTLWGRTAEAVFNNTATPDALKKIDYVYKSAVDICKPLAPKKKERDEMQAYTQCTPVPNLLKTFAENLSCDEHRQDVLKTAENLDVFFDSAGFVFDNSKTGGLHHWSQVLLSARPKQ